MSPKSKAWCVHLFTASGAGTGLMACQSIAQNNPRGAFFWMLMACAIDGIDGTFARRCDVQTHAPEIDGRRLDDIVDYFTWVVTPIMALAWWGLLPGWPVLWAMPLMASALGMSHTQAKTDDDYFQGFPSLWNIVALFLWRWQLSPDLNAGIVIVLSLLVLAPLKFVYPSKTPTLKPLTNLLMAIWCLQILIGLVSQGELAQLCWRTSWIFPLYYVALSAYLQLRQDNGPSQ